VGNWYEINEVFGIALTLSGFAFALLSLSFWLLQSETLPISIRLGLFFTLLVVCLLVSSFVVYRKNKTIDKAKTAESLFEQL